MTREHQAGAVRIQSWLYANLSTNGLSATVVACFKITGAITDRGGDPTWNDATYAVDFGIVPGEWQMR